MKTLAETRDEIIHQIVAEDIDAYLHGKRTRRCASCGSSFKPRSRYHFNCQETCRKPFYRGQFHPREEKTTRRRRAA